MKFKEIIISILITSIFIGCGSDNNESSVVNSNSVSSSNIDEIINNNAKVLEIKLTSAFDPSTDELVLYQLNSSKGQVNLGMGSYGILADKYLYSINGLLPVSSASLPRSNFGNIDIGMLDGITLYEPSVKRSVEIDVSSSDLNYTVKPETLHSSGKYVLELKKKIDGSSTELLSFTMPALERIKYGYFSRVFFEYIYDGSKIDKILFYREREGCSLNASAFRDGVPYQELNATRENAIAELEKAINSDSCLPKSYMQYIYNENNISIYDCSGAILYRNNCSGNDGILLTEDDSLEDINASVLIKLNDYGNIIEYRNSKFFNNKKHFKFSYNENQQIANRLVESLYGNDENISISYNDNGDVTSVNEVSYEYDENSNLLKTSLLGGSVSILDGLYEYNESLPVIENILNYNGNPARVKNEISYNINGRPTQILSYEAIGENEFFATPSIHEYVYNSDGSLSHIIPASVDDDHRITFIYE